MKKKRDIVRVYTRSLAGNQSGGIRQCQFEDQYMSTIVTNLEEGKNIPDWDNVDRTINLENIMETMG